MTKSKTVNSRISALASAVALATLSGQAGAAGFALIEMGGSGMGNAFAGGAAIAQDPSTVFFNPAGMTKLRGTQATFAAHIIEPTADFKNEGSTLTPIVGGAPLSGGNGGGGGETGYVPNFYYVRDVGSNMKFGLGINVPFGLETSYDRDWVGRYHAIDSELRTVNINPSLAYKLSDRVSVGAGISIQYAEARLTNAIDFGTIHILGGGTLLAPQSADGFAEVEGDDVGFGVNVGLLVEPEDGTRIGVAYRSSVKQTLEGDAKFEVSNPIAAATAGALGLVNTNVEAEVELPDTLSFSVWHQLDPQWEVMADFTWTNWSLFDEVRIEFDSGASDSVTTTNWNDSNRYSVGVNYKRDAHWTWRAGLAFDETPVPDAQRRTPRIPGEDRTWLAFGFGYTSSDKHLTVDVGYAHLFIDDPEIAKTGELFGGEDTTRGALIGSYDADVDILSAQLNWRF